MNFHLIVSFSYRQTAFMAREFFFRRCNHWQEKLPVPSHEEDLKRVNFCILWQTKWLYWIFLLLVPGGVTPLSRADVQRMGKVKLTFYIFLCLEHKIHHFRWGILMKGKGPASSYSQEQCKHLKDKILEHKQRNQCIVGQG